MNEQKRAQLRERLPRLRDLERRGYVAFRVRGLTIVRDLPVEEVDDELNEELAVAEEWSEN